MNRIIEGIEKITKINMFYLLVIFLLLLDSYTLIFLNKGILDINFLEIFNIDNIFHFVILLIIFAITYFWLSILLYTILYKIWWASPISKIKNKSNFVELYELKKEAIETRNSVLMDYIKTEERKILQNLKIRKTIYSLFIVIIIDGIEKNSLVRIILRNLVDNIDIKIKVFSWVIFIFFCGIIFFTIFNSIQNEDDEKIYFKK